MFRPRLFLIGLLVFTPLFITIAQNDTAYHHWNDRVFYEIFVRSFYDSDGDGIGDLQGVIQKLDYLNDGDPNTSNDLGITGIWLMPIAEATSYHGYDVEDYRNIETDYGSNEDMRELVLAAEERGIAVIVDLVVNHTSVNHPWFASSAAQEEPYTDWYIWEEEHPGYQGPWGAPAWHELDDRFYYGIFWSGMPDLNHKNPDVVAEMYDIARFWLEDMGVAGFRLDAVKHVVEEGTIQENSPSNRQWLIDFDSFIDTVNPDALTVGEFFNTPSFLVSPYVEQDAIDIAFDFDWARAVLSSVLAKNPRDLTRIQKQVLQEYPSGQFASFITNHDLTRLMSQLLEDVGRNRVAVSILLTSPGVPFLYYGEEIGMVGAGPDERLRTPMHWDDSPTAGFTSASEPWQPLVENVGFANVAAQTDDDESLLNHYREMIQLLQSSRSVADRRYVAR